MPDYEADREKIDAYERAKDEELCRKVTGLVKVMNQYGPKSKELRQYILSNRTEERDEFERLAFTFILLKVKGIEQIAKELEQEEKERQRGNLNAELSDYLSSQFDDSWKQENEEPDIT